LFCAILLSGFPPWDPFFLTGLCRLAPRPLCCFPFAGESKAYTFQKGNLPSHSAMLFPPSAAMITGEVVPDALSACWWSLDSNYPSSTALRTFRLSSLSLRVLLRERRSSHPAAVRQTFPNLFYLFDSLMRTNTIIESTLSPVSASLVFLSPPTTFSLSRYPSCETGKSIWLLQFIDILYAFALSYRRMSGPRHFYPKREIPSLLFQVPKILVLFVAPVSEDTDR